MSASGTWATHGMPRPGYDRWVSFPRPRLDHRPGAEHRRRRAPAPGLHHRSPERPCRRVPAPAARASRSRCSSPTRRCIPTPSRRPTARSTSRKGGYRPAPRHADLYKGAALSAPAQRAAVGRSGEGQAGLDGGVRAAGQRGLAQGARRHPGRHRRGDPPARRHDGLGRRGHGRCLRGAGGDRPARRHLHPVPGRQRLFLRRARAGAGAPLRLRGGHQVAVPRALSRLVQAGHGERRSGAGARHRADACVDLAGGKAADFEHMQGLSLRPLRERRRAQRAGARRSCASISARTPCRG